MAKLRPVNGFTLLELSVSVFIFILLGTAVTTVMSHGARIWRHGTERLEVEENLRLAMDRVVREIRESSALSSPSPDKLILDVPENGTTVKVEYWFKDGQIFRKRKGGTNPLAINVSGADFYCAAVENPGSVHIRFWGVTGDGETISLSSAASGRADK
ncbi:hypothetical protein DCCM_4523 [Desulfocucumis palustris]|uniref:Prepilin-type N-terminal cleavage/methylation domain-containing protein n=2 Tax=Desulfocucumis palustris TaxID=1898651 RepID=A0A2L2XGY8_9FIRM|nr:hypothetical protein DCCM_4523 [Desulfocucumis palustris]